MRPTPLFALLALTFAVVMNVGSYWFSDTIVLRMHNAQEIGPNDSPEIFSMVQRLAQRAQIPMPKVYIIPDDSPNAFATGRSPAKGAVAMTIHRLRLRLRELTRDEIADTLSDRSSVDAEMQELMAALRHH